MNYRDEDFEEAYRRWGDEYMIDPYDGRMIRRRDMADYLRWQREKYGYRYNEPYYGGPWSRREFEDEVFEHMRRREELEAYRKSLWFKREAVEDAVKTVRELIAEQTQDYPYVREAVISNKPPKEEGDRHHMHVVWSFKIGPMGKDLISVDGDENGLRVEVFDPAFINGDNIKKLAHDFLWYRNKDEGDGYVSICLKNLFKRDDHRTFRGDASRDDCKTAIKECVLKIKRFNKFLEKMEKSPLEKVVAEKDALEAKIAELRDEQKQLVEVAETKILKMTSALEL